MLLLDILSTIGVFDSIGQKSNSSSNKEQQIIKEIKRLMNYELKLFLHHDPTAMEKFYPNDMAVTNPFNQFIDKRKVIEIVVPTEDALRSDAGKTVNLRFTKVWMRRDKE